MADTSTLRPQGPFSLAESSSFLEGFTPVDHATTSTGSKLVTAAGHLHLAVAVPSVSEPVAICLRQSEHGEVVEVKAESEHEEVVTLAVAQVTRMLSLDVDARAFAEVGERDPVIGRLQAARSGFRPVGFASPWEAAVWAVLSQRTRMTQAAAVRRRIAHHHGTAVSIHGQSLQAFPGPGVLADVVDALPMSEVKRRRLGAVAHAALDGRLDADRLRRMDVDQALAELQEIDGIGPFSAELILLRGAMLVDVLPVRERRLLAGVGDLYGIDDPDTDDLASIAQAWAPYRTWCAVLVRSALESR